MMQSIEHAAGSIKKSRCIPLEARYGCFEGHRGDLQSRKY